MDTCDKSRGAAARTLVELVERRASEHPDRTAFRLLSDGDFESDSLTYSDLSQRARAVAVELSAMCGPGDRAILLYASGLDFVIGFFGCLHAGLIAVPAYTLDPGRLSRTIARLETMIEDAEPSVALTDRASLEAIQRLIPDHPKLARVRWIATEDVAVESSAKWVRPQQDPDATAVIQYTSGSTTTPRGVMLSHRNILANEEVFANTFGYSNETTFLGWVPLAHDLGLFAHVVLPLYVGASSVLMTPEAFIQNPSRWLKAVAEYPNAATHAPNFAYELSARRFAAEELAGLDLSRMHTADLGGEPVRPETLDLFERTFGTCGFQRDQLVAAYGLAEATLLVSSARNPRMMRLNAEELARDHVVVDEREDAPVKVLVSLGKPTPRQRVAIVDPQNGKECSAGQVGEIWVNGPNVGQGYWRKLEATQRTFQALISGTNEGPFLRTGDLGFLDQGELFVTGRLKDVVILHGRNHYPQDFEFTVEKCDHALRPGCTAAFSIDTQAGEGLAVVQELRGRDATLDFNELIRKIRRALFQEHGLNAHAIALVASGSVPKTSSGKIQRQACRAAYLSGALKIIHLWVDRPRLSDSRVPPSSPIEKKLAVIWSRALNVPAESIGVGDGFFDLGGDSLAAIQCVAEIRGDFQIEELAPETFIYAPTLSQMARVLSESDSSAPRATEIIPIQPRGDGVPLVMVAPGVECRSIAKRLGPNHPVLGILGADLGRRKSAPVLTEIVSEYTQALLKAVSHGPYALCGWCGAGVVALEIARELERRGEKVAFVAILDAREVYFPPMRWTQRVFVRAWRHWQRVLLLGRRVIREGAAPLKRSVGLRTDRVMRLGRGELPNHADAFLRSLLTWSPRPWAGRVLHVWAVDRPLGRYRDLAFEWGDLTPNSTFVEVPGDHWTMLQGANATGVAWIIAAELESATAESLHKVHSA